jgi:hypothetical protein
MEAEAITCELDKQIEYTVSLLAEGCHHAKLEAAVLELVAWFDLWREASGLPDSREAVRDFARLVNDAVEVAGLTDQDLCDMFDVSLPIVHRWRAGETAPQPATRKRIAARLEEMSGVRGGAEAGDAVGLEGRTD